MKKLAVIALILLAGCAVALTWGVYYLTGTPMYSLYLVRTAVQEGDSETFFKHFDVSLVGQNATRRIVGGLPAPLQTLASHVSGFTGPAVEAVLRQKIDEKLKDPDKSFVKGKSIESVRYENATAIVTVKSDSDGSTTTITLAQMADRHWKIVDLDLGEHGIRLEIPSAPAENVSPPPTAGRPEAPPLPRRLRRQ
jgi:hypothetical protein